MRAVIIVTLASLATLALLTLVTPATGLRPLQDAAMKGDLAQVKKLLSEGFDADEHGELGWTPMQWAAGNGHLEVMQCLFNQGASLDTRDEDGWAPMHYAAAHGHLEVVKWLTEQEAKVDAKDEKGATPAHWAAQFGHLEVVKWLTLHGTDVETSDVENHTLICWADRDHHIEVVKWLAKHGAEVHFKNFFRNLQASEDSELHVAAANGDLAKLMSLIAEGANVNQKNEGGQTALQWAAGGGHLVVVRWLTEQGAEVNAKDENGKTAMHWAAPFGYLDVVQWLAQNKADVDAKDDENGKTSLHFAAENGQVELVKWLTQDKADVEAKDKEGETPVSVAAYNGHLDVVKRLVRDGASMDTRDAAHHTPMHHAAEFGYLELVQWLMKQGADVEAIDKYGKTPMQTAALNGRWKLVLVLAHSKAKLGPLRTNYFEAGGGCGDPEFGKVLKSWHWPLPLTRRCLKEISKDSLRVWFEVGGSPLATLPNGIPYETHLSRSDTKNEWRSHLTWRSELERVLTNAHTWMAIIGGFAAACVALLVRHWMMLGFENGHAPSRGFRKGARLKVADHFHPPRQIPKRLYRALEVVSNVVFLAGAGGSYLWWPYFVPALVLTILIPAFYFHGSAVMRSPALVIAATSPCQVALAALRIAMWLAVVLSAVYYEDLRWESKAWYESPSCTHLVKAKEYQNATPNWKKLHYFARNKLHDALQEKVKQFLVDQSLDVPIIQGWLPGFVKEPEHFLNAENIIIAFGYVLFASAVLYLLASALYVIAVCQGWIVKGEERPAQDEMMKELTNLLDSGRSLHQGVICSADGRELMPENCSVYLKISWIFLDVALDVNTVITLLCAQQFKFSFCLIFIISVSFLQQLFFGNLGEVRAAMAESVERGVMRDDLIDLINEERGLEAFLSLIITSYSLIFCVNSAGQALTQMFSILMAVIGLTMFLYQQLDLDLIDSSYTPLEGHGRDLLREDTTDTELDLVSKCMCSS